LRQVHLLLSHSKIKWLKDSLNLKNDTNYLFGTIDTFLIWKLTDGKNFFTDVTNASRTSLFSIKECKYDDDLLRIFDLKDIELPDIKENADFFGETKLFGGNIKISGVAGDQQAALIGQTGFDLGSVKSTYGTGCFLMLNTGKNLIQSKSKQPFNQDLDRKHGLNHIQTKLFRAFQMKEKKIF